MEPYPFFWQQNPYDSKELLGFSFSTQYGLFYQCDLTYYVFFPWPAYSIDLYYVQNQKPYPWDIRVLRTVGTALLEHLEQEPNTIFFYVSDNSDGKELKRANSFLRAFQQANPQRLRLHTETIVRENSTYLGFLWHTKHPEAGRLEVGVAQEIKTFLAQK